MTDPLAHGNLSSDALLPSTYLTREATVFVPSTGLFSRMAETLSRRIFRASFFREPLWKSDLYTHTHNYTTNTCTDVQRSAKQGDDAVRNLRGELCTRIPHVLRHMARSSRRRVVGQEDRKLKSCDSTRINILASHVKTRRD